MTATQTAGHALTANRYRHHAVYNFLTDERESHYLTYNECCDFIADTHPAPYEIRNDADCIWNAR